MTFNDLLVTLSTNKISYKKVSNKVVFLGLCVLHILNLFLFNFLVELNVNDAISIALKVTIELIIAVSAIIKLTNVASSSEDEEFNAAIVVLLLIAISNIPIFIFNEELIINYVNVIGKYLGEIMSNENRALIYISNAIAMDLTLFLSILIVTLILSAGD